MFEIFHVGKVVLFKVSTSIDSVLDTSSASVLLLSLDVLLLRVIQVGLSIGPSPAGRPHSEIFVSG